MDISYRCEGGTKPRQKYAFELQLFGEINQENCKVKKAGRELLIVLSKKDNKAPYWPRLTEGKQKAHNVQVDFNRWRDEEDSSGDEYYKDDEFESVSQFTQNFTVALSCVHTLILYMYNKPQVKKMCTFLQFYK